jgi:hypothetical protein
MAKFSKVGYNFSGKWDDVSGLLRKFSTDTVLKRVNRESVDLLKNRKEHGLPAAKHVNFKMYKTKRRIPYYQDAIITAWTLIDLAYYSIITSNDYRGKKIDSEEELYLLATAIDNYREREEEHFIDEQHANRENDFLLYFWGFAGEQFKTEVPALVFDNMDRDLYMLLEMNDENSFDVKGTVLDEIGVSWNKVITYLMLGWFGFTEEDSLSNVNKRIGWKHDSDREEFEKVILRYTTNYDEVRQSKLGRQILYANPYIKTQHGEIVSASTYLTLFLCEHSILWLVRNHFNKKDSQFFTNYFGGLFERYFAELLNECLETHEYIRIEEDDTEKADWRLEIGDNKFLIEQKSTVMRLSAKQQHTDIDAIKNFAKRTILKAVSQLSNTEKEFADGKYIKIILLFEDYLEPELLEQFMKMPECKVDNDNYFWLMTIEEAEMFFCLCKSDRVLFEKIVSEKINREINHSNEGRGILKILNKNGVVENLYLRNEKFTKYRDSINKQAQELL